MDYILFVCSIVACVIGILTFVVGMNGRSKEDGILVQKINQAIEGIEELKVEVKNVASNEQSLALLVTSHEEQIKTLFRLCNTADVTTQALITIMKTLERMETEVHNNEARYSN